MKKCLLCNGPEHYSTGCPATYSANDYLSLQALYIERLRDIKDLQDDLNRYRKALETIVSSAQGFATCTVEYLELIAEDALGKMGEDYSRERGDQ